MDRICEKASRGGAEAAAEPGGGKAGLKPAASLVALLLLLYSLFAAAGCGDEEEAQVDAGAGTTATAAVTVEQGFDPDLPQLTADDIPVATGVTHEYLANTPGDTVDVAFDLEGPWDLEAGPADATLVTAYVDREDAPAGDELVNADLAAVYAWEEGAATTEYIYQSLGENAWVVYGRSDDSDIILALEGTSRLLLFPLTVGDNWQDSYTEITDEEARDVTVTGTALAFGEVTVPAGTFEAFLVQTLVTVTGPEEPVTTIVYTWFSPGTGRVAEIVSLPDEEDRQFTTAASILRLRDFDDAG